MVKKVVLMAAAVIAFTAGCGSPASTAPAVETPASLPPTSTQPTLEPTQQSQPSATEAELPPAATPTPTPLAPLDLTSDVESIRLRMLHSHENWRSIWVQLHLVEYPPEGSDQLIHLQRVQVWIRQPAEVWLLSGSWGDVPPDYFFVSDGVRFLEADLRAGTTAEGDLAPSIPEPFSPPEGITDTITPHPLEGLIGFPAGQMIFPAGLAQRQGTYELIGEDTVEGRAALIVDFTPGPTGLISDRFRIDALTGLLLRDEVLGKTGGGERVESDISVGPIIYDPEIPAGLFTLDVPENPRWQEAPE